MDNQKYGMLFETSPNSHYYFDAGTGKVITCSTEERDFIEKVQIAIQNGHLCHVRRSVCDIIGGQPKTN